MTLAFRLGLLAVFGLLVAIILTRTLWPASSPGSVVAHSSKSVAPLRIDYQGNFVAKNKAGNYKLQLLKEQKAKLQFVDSDGKEYAYRGHLAAADKIVWTEHMKKGRWTKLGNPVEDPLVSIDKSTFDLREGRFKRVQK